MRTPRHRHQRERRRRAHRGRERRRPAAASRCGRTTTARARRSATSVQQRPQRREPDGQQPPAPPRIRPERPRIEARRRRRRQAQARGGERVRHAGRDARPASVSMKKRTRRPFSVRNQPSASARLTTRWRAASPSLSRGSTTPGGCRAPPRRQHRARAGVAAGVGGDVQQPRRPEHRRAPRPPRRCAASASASACRLAAANASSTSTVTSCSDSSPNRLAADRPRSTISRPRRRPGERIVRRARGVRGHERTDCGDRGRKSASARPSRTRS